MSGASRTAGQLRQDFDRSFGAAVHGETEPEEDFLAIRLGGDAQAIRLAEIACLLPLGAVTRFPSPLPELLGIMGLRGAIVPVYDLRALLGYSASDSPRWLIIAAAWPVALAFDTFEGHMRLARAASAQPLRIEPSRRHVHEVLRTPQLFRPIVSMASILETIRIMVQQAVV
jgi:chemotaxis signal transduction protein